MHYCFPYSKDNLNIAKIKNLHSSAHGRPLCAQPILGRDRDSILEKAQEGSKFAGTDERNICDKKDTI